MNKLETALAEVNEVSDRMIERLQWNNIERSTKIQEMATNGHEPSKKLITHFKMWYIHLSYKSITFVEETEKMIAHFDEYRAAGYVE